MLFLGQEGVVRFCHNLKDWKMRIKTIVLAGLLFIILHTPTQARVIYVDDDATGANDGSSWQNAYTYLQDALTDAKNATKPVEIRVAQGIYKPDQGSGINHGNKEASFHLMNQVAIKGGYAGIIKINPNEQNIELYETILSGDLEDNDIDVNDPIELIDEPTRSDNSRKVVNGSSTDQTAVLDGFIITGGCNKTLVIDVLDGGGGMYISFGNPTIKNCKFIDNATNYFGGGIFNIGHSNPVITNCLIINNYASRSGGGIFNASSNPVLFNCYFKSNNAYSGGGIYNTYNRELIGNDKGSNPKIINCLFTSNYATRGGGIYNVNSVDNNDNSSEPNIINCTFTRNFAKINGGGIYNSVSRLINSIIWGNFPDQFYNSGNSNISYCDIQGGLEGEGNINADPLFANPGYWADANDTNIVVEPNAPNAIWIEGDYHLKSQAGRFDPNIQSWIIDDVTSPCIDAGDPNSPIGLEPFPNGGYINMGVYGGTSEASKSYFGKPVCETIVAGDINGDCKVNQADLDILMFHWLEEKTNENK
jgi:hypothetical protein